VSVINFSAYRFAALDNLKELREELTNSCRDWQLKGTILLSTEGINLFVAGAAPEMQKLLAYLHTVPGLAGLQPKVSESREQPFTRMLVKIKKEIIAFGVPEIDPIHNPAPSITAVELKQWLDEGRPVTLLDTRNDFEVSLGTFDNAQAIGITQFRDFPAAVQKLSPTEAKQPIVTFCTGGIRCEKAAPYMIAQGFENVFQLEGGILKYFELVGHAHYHGECFVFDKRVGLAADLDESGHGMCYACQSLLTAEELADPLTVEGIACPRCYRSPEATRAASLAEHQAKLREVVNPLPGSRPEDNFRPIRIAEMHAGWSLLEVVCAIFPHISREVWQANFAAGDIVDQAREPVVPTQVVQPGEHYFTREQQQIEPDVNPAIEILHEDAALIVVHKPAPLPMHSSGRFNRNTLQSILATVYAPQKPRPAHRLDANTTGIAVFTRTAAFAKLVQPQFEKGEVQKRYLARIHGHPPEDVFASQAKIAATTAQSGARVIDDENGLEAHTDFRVLARRADGTSLLEVTPHTGRTNQIRVHLWHLGWPILGDPMYLPGQVLGEMQTREVESEVMCLHAWKLTLKHPQTGEPVTFEAAKPEWAK
jgi:UPF0176 protein